MSLKIFDIENTKGVITTIDVDKDSVVYEFKGTYILEPTRTSIQVDSNNHVEDELGQYVNHNCNPNIKVVKEDEMIKLISIKNIKKDTEITFDYNSTEYKLSNPFECNCHGKLIKGSYYSSSKECR
jgi:hypothetical protein